MTGKAKKSGKSAAPTVKAKPAVAAAAAVPKPTAMPLFFKQPRVLDAAHHGKSSVSPVSDFAFTRETNSIPLNALEFIEAGKSYPIVFTMAEDAPQPVAIVGLEKQNAFLDAKNQWRTGHYIPAYVRQYPFIFFERAELKKFFLCIDEAAPHYHTSGKTAGNQPLYNPDGTPSDMTNHALKFCTDFYQHHIITRNFSKDLVAHKLLAPYHSEAKLQDGRVVTLTGFQIIDETAFNKLPAKTLTTFRDKGWLPFIYLALASGSNWKNLASASV